MVKKILSYTLGSEARVGRCGQAQVSSKRIPEGFGKKVTGHILLTDQEDQPEFRNLKVIREPDNEFFPQFFRADFFSLLLHHGSASTADHKAVLWSLKLLSAKVGVKLQIKVEDCSNCADA